MTARYLLDTDTASYAIRGAFPALDARLATVAPHDMAISVITRAELLFGLEKRGNPARIQFVLSGLLQIFRCSHFDVFAQLGHRSRLLI